MRSAQVLVDASVVARLERGGDGIAIVGRSDFGEGLWLLAVSSDRIPAGSGATLELVVIDERGRPVPARFNPWREL